MGKTNTPACCQEAGRNSAAPFWVVTQGRWKGISGVMVGIRPTGQSSRTTRFVGGWSGTGDGLRRSP